MRTVNVSPLKTPEVIPDVVMKDTVKTYRFNFTPWADASTVTEATWTLKAGQATITNEILTSGQSSATITFSQEGRALIEVTASTGSETNVQYLEVTVRDPHTTLDDYGL